MSVSFKDYKDDKGGIDWQAYREAQAEVGEICHRCHKYLILENIGATLFGREGDLPQRRLCSDCKHLDQDTGREVRHEKYIRCPKCGHQSFVHDWEMCDYGEVFYAEGTHDIYCPQCEHEFTIATHVSYTYESPPMLTGEEQENPDD